MPSELFKISEIRGNEEYEEGSDVGNQSIGGKVENKQPLRENREKEEVLKIQSVEKMKKEEDFNTVIDLESYDTYEKRD